jgi:hypothetical protein
MKHDSYTCPPHCGGCECEDPDSEACNPYWLPGFCPTDGEGTECLATRTTQEYLSEGPPWMHDGDEGRPGRNTIIVAGVEVEL